MADGTIALIGGVSGTLKIGGEEKPADSLAKETEIYNPFKPDDSYSPLEGTWSVGSMLQFPRNYHSTVLLIPDGRLWIAGSNINSDQYPGREEMEYYIPDYLTCGPRPQYTLASSRINYDQEFVIYLRDGWALGEIKRQRVGIIKCSSATHRFCVDQRYIGLEVLNPETDKDATEIMIKAPPNGNIATPGYYMLFVLSTTGAPSVAEIFQLS